MTLLRTAMILAALALAACVSKPVAPPRRVPPPALAAAPPRLAPPVLGWEDRALTPGNWSYTQDGRGGLALYGVAGTSPALTIRCDRAARRIFVSRPGAIPARMTLRATTGARAYDARPAGPPPPTVAAELTPSDPQLDALGFSRGRFLVALDGAPDIIVPSWPEVARVVEDCRG